MTGDTLTTGGYRFTGTTEELDAFLREAADAGIHVDVQDRRRTRGDGPIIVLLVLQGVGHIIERVVDHYFDKVTKRDEQKPERD